MEAQHYYRTAQRYLQSVFVDGVEPIMGEPAPDMLTSKRLSFLPPVMIHSAGSGRRASDIANVSPGQGCDAGPFYEIIILGARFRGE
jgi:hypothetical protein